jgi:predicted MPP superfamily phosphohydrolase
MASGFPDRRRRRKRKLVLAALVLLPLALFVWMYWSAIADPVVRRTAVDLPGLERPVRVLLMADIHVGGPDMPPARLARIVAQVNDEAPDVVLIAGDLITEKRLASHIYTMAEAVAPLAGLRPRIGTFAVLGNHDHWADAAAARAALRRAGIRVLDNDAAAAGPLAVGGLDDAFTGRDDVGRTVAALRRLPGVPILVSHSPDPFPRVPPGIGLMVAGHTHCGQIRLPFLGAPKTMSAYGQRYACGRIDEAGKTLVVTAGLGTSGIWLRLGAVPDVWLIELRPVRAPSPPPRSR